MKYMIILTYSKEIYDYTGNNQDHWIRNKGFKEKFGSPTGRTFNRLATKDINTWNMTYNIESTAV